MFVRLGLFLVLALESSAIPVNPGFDQNPPGLYHGDIKLTPKQEEQISLNPNTVLIDTALRWHMDLEGFVIVPYIFDPEANYSEFLQL